LYLDSIGSEPLRFRLDQLVFCFIQSVAQDRAQTEIEASLSRRQIHGNHSIKSRTAAASAEVIISKNRKTPVQQLALQAAGEAFLNGS
jgi:hypothetical protein